MDDSIQLQRDEWKSNKEEEGKMRSTFKFRCRSCGIFETSANVVVSGVVNRYNLNQQPWHGSFRSSTIDRVTSFVQHSKQRGIGIQPEILLI